MRVWLLSLLFGAGTLELQLDVFVVIASLLSRNEHLVWYLVHFVLLLLGICFSHVERVRICCAAMLNQRILVLFDLIPRHFTQLNLL